MNAVALRVNKLLVRREFWENRSLWMVPTVVIGILTVLSLYMLLAVVIGHNQAVNEVDIAGGPHFKLDNMPDFSTADSDQINAFVTAGTFFLGLMFSSIMKIVLFFYLLDSLYAERRDRSVLFWRSMPVSDTRSVLAKLATAMLSFTAITFVATVALELILLVFMLIMGSVLGVHPWSILLHPWSFLSSWLLLAYGLIVQAIWFLPYFGWVMLASSWAKKAPFLWAVLVPLGIMGAEGWVFHSAHIARMVALHSLNWLALAYNFVPEMMKGNGNDLTLTTHMMGIENLGRLLASPELWVGTALGAAFIYGAIWLRRNRSEI
jgi:ABC-2 type transport system permease protein